MLAESPGGYSTLLAAALTLDTPPASVLLAGAAADCATWQRTLEATYRPDVRVLDLAACPDVPPALVKGAAPASGAVAWVCRGTTCLPPLVSILDVAEALAPSGARVR